MSISNKTIESTGFSRPDANVEKQEMPTQEDNKTSKVGPSVLMQTRTQRSLSASSITKSVKNFSADPQIRELRTRMREKLDLVRSKNPEPGARIEFDKKEWEKTVFQALESFTQRKIAEGVTNSEQIVQQFIEEKYLSTLPIQQNIQDTSEVGLYNLSDTFQTITSAKQFLNNFNKLTNGRKRALQVALGGQEVMDALQRYNDSKLVTKFQNHVEELVKIASAASKLDKRKIFLPEGFDRKNMPGSTAARLYALETDPAKREEKHPKNFANAKISGSNLVYAFRAYFASGDHECKPFIINGQEVFPPYVGNLKDGERQRVFMKWLVQKLNAASGVTSTEEELKQQVELLLSEPMDAEKETWLKTGYEKIPCFRVLQALTVNARNKAYQVLEGQYPELFPNLSNREFDKMQMKELPTEPTSYEITINAQKGGFVVTHAKPLHFLTGRTSEQELYGTVDMRWQIRGNTRGDRFASSLEMSHLKLTGPIKTRFEILKKLKLT